MKRFTKFFRIVMICLVLGGGSTFAQSPTADSTKSTTAAGAPASNDPSVTPVANSQKNKPADLMTTRDSSGKWGLLGLLGLFGLFGLKGKSSRES